MRKVVNKGLVSWIYKCKNEEVRKVEQGIRL